MDDRMWVTTEVCKMIQWVILPPTWSVPTLSMSQKLQHHNTPSPPRIHPLLNAHQFPKHMLPKVHPWVSPRSDPRVTMIAEPYDKTTGVVCLTIMLSVLFENWCCLLYPSVIVGCRSTSSRTSFA
jgi:hypothetical protein